MSWRTFRCGISCFHTNLSGFYSNFPHPTFTLNPETTPPTSLCRAVKPQILGYLAVKVAMTTMVQIIATFYDLAFRATLVDSQSPSILVRSRKSPGIHVGLRVVDVLFPVAKGQRELVIGDRQSGKSTIWLCSFVSQQSLNAYLVRRRKISSVGSMVGGRLSTTVRLTRTIARVGARAECALLVSGVTDSMGA